MIGCSISRLLFSIIAGFLLVIVNAISAQGSKQVGLYEVFEFRVLNKGIYSNPFDFNEIELKATFISPRGRSIKFFGFYDGDGNGGQSGTLWKVRFLPDEIGSWNYFYEWSDGSAGGRGSFTVGDSSNKGLLKIDPLNPHHLIFTRGEHFFWNGDTEWFFLSDHFSQKERFDAINFLSKKNVNNLLMTLVNDDRFDVYPWIGRPESLIKNRFDLRKMRMWEDVIRKLKEKDIIADLWFYSDDSKRFYPEAGSPQEDLYFKYIIARFGVFSNVTWNLGLEYSEYRSSEWVKMRAEFLKNNDPFNHLLSIHQTPSQYYSFPGNTNLDHSSLQQLEATHDILNSVTLKNRKSTTDAGFPIPIMIEEFYIEGEFGDLDQFRQGIWSIAMAGGYYKAASLGWWIGTPFKKAKHFDTAKILYDFITNVRWWEMFPANDKTNIGYALVKPTEKYLIYLPSGTEVVVDLSDASGTFYFKWFNPRTGQINGNGSAEGGKFKTFTAPDNKDWVLHIEKVI